MLLENKRMGYSALEGSLLIHESLSHEVRFHLERENDVYENSILKLNTSC